MDHLERFVGRRKARELGALPLVQKNSVVRHELLLTAVLNSLVEASKQEKVPMGLIGGMGLSPLYLWRHTVRRRSVGNIDIEIPQDVSERKIARLFETAGLNPPESLPDVYLRGSLASRSNVGGRTIDVMVARLTPSTRQFNDHTLVRPYTNHIIASFNLEPLSFRQFKPAYLIASKGLALADPNRSVSKGKMDDLHDLMHVGTLESSKHVLQTLKSGVFGQVDLQKLSENLSTVVDNLEEAYELYADNWLPHNIFTPNAAVTPSEWKTALRAVKKTFGAKGYSPLVSIRTKLQLAEPDKVVEFGRKILGNVERPRSGLVARQLEPIIEERLDKATIARVSQLPTQTMVRRLQKLLASNNQ